MMGAAEGGGGGKSKKKFSPWKLFLNIYSYGFWPKQYLPKEEKKISPLHVQK